MGLGIGCQILEVGVNGPRNCFGLNGKQDAAEAGADGGFGGVAHAQAHRRRGAVRQQHALGVLGVPDAVVEEVPVKAVHAGIVGVATGAALPALETEGAVVEIEFAQAVLGHREIGAEASFLQKWYWGALQIDDFEGVRKEAGDNEAGSFDDGGAGPFAVELDPFTQAGEEGQIVGNVGFDPRGRWRSQGSGGLRGSRGTGRDGRAGQGSR